ncbi:MAG: serine hydrolase [Prevotella sp.]|nr:serine hydrolase [Prevotella sp.]
MTKKFWWRLGALVLAAVLLAGFFAGVVWLAGTRVTAYVNAADAMVGGTSARGMCTMDVATGRVLFAHNADQPMGMASTTKVVTALTVLEHCQDLDTKMRVADAAIGIEGSSIYLQKGEQLTVRELLYGLMLRSGNDAAVALALAVAPSIAEFAALMNQTAAKYGATKTHFMNPHGLDDPDHYTTARDLAKLSAVALQNPTFVEICSAQEKRIDGVDGPRLLINKNKLLKSLDGCIGVKTGYTKKTGRSFVGAREVDGQKIVCVVLNCGPMFPESAQLLKDADALYHNKTVLSAEEIFVDQHGTKGLALSDFSYPLTQAELERLEITIIENTVIIKLDGTTIYQGDCVNIGDGSPGANAR